jgi:hypothetical protein
MALNTIKIGMYTLKKQIPCKDCICLAICKSKTEISCSLLFDYLDLLDSKHSIDQAWNWLEKEFRRGTGGLSIDKKDNYTNIMFKVD